ncbi:MULTISPECIES: hypothetical protein [unclassified Sphingopyxis]|jgi:hypothetical protein|nr:MULTISPECIES: hypothetical protein [unclassified Sphingopyxis]
MTKWLVRASHHSARTVVAVAAMANVIVAKTIRAAIFSITVPFLIPG